MGGTGAEPLPARIPESNKELETLAPELGVGVPMRGYVDHPLEAREKYKWRTDTRCGNCMSYVGPNVLTHIGPALREPVGALHRAGTETSDVWSDPWTGWPVRCIGGEGGHTVEDFVADRFLASHSEIEHEALPLLAVVRLPWRGGLHAPQRCHSGSGGPIRLCREVGRQRRAAPSLQ